MLLGSSDCAWIKRDENPCRTLGRYSQMKEDSTAACMASSSSCIPIYFLCQFEHFLKVQCVFLEVLARKSLLELVWSINTFDWLHVTVSVLSISLKNLCLEIGFHKDTKGKTEKSVSAEDRLAFMYFFLDKKFTLWFIFLRFGHAICRFYRCLYLKSLFGKENLCYSQVWW